MCSPLVGMHSMSMGKGSCRDDEPRPLREETDLVHPLMGVHSMAEGALAYGA